MAQTRELTFWQRIADGDFREMVESLDNHASAEINWQYGTHNYKPLPVSLERADNARVWDADGREYIDCIGSYSATAHGHLNDKIIEALEEQLRHVAVVSRAFNSAEVGLFLKGLCEFCELDKACPMNTGAEAVETAIKLARKWAYTVKGVPIGEAEIISFADNFHGRTTTIVGMSTEEGYRHNFGPFTPGFKTVPFGDIDALRTAIGPNTCAVLAEPIQAEGGILIPPEGWLTAVRELCDEHNVLLIWDEIQTGFYRTGHKFAWMVEKGARPDIMTVGKPLGGGILPVSAAVGREHVMGVFEPGDHGSTFGGNPLGSAVALAALAQFETSDIPERTSRLGTAAIERLRSLDIPAIKEVRGRGLLIGIELVEGFDTAALTRELIGNGVLTKETRKRTFRLTPPLTIEEDVLEDALGRVERSIRTVADR